ncbi:hypothetical protein BOTBODRAFT_69895 [Botryobasidium botryosum FD-172 SS1]|uniref:Uncharacterized protein n=1 Tax=Botryobasidium botryosum (strain FD-172 SS1) TaxID=930990 RepID=A0A067M9I9_BOTB1|nr:hypothetical protein BOTBODRAFT_69895 [Botryobasidium botryosum FD-172 SS1]
MSMPAAPRFRTIPLPAVEDAEPRRSSRSAAQPASRHSPVRDDRAPPPAPRMRPISLPFEDEGPLTPPATPAKSPKQLPSPRPSPRRR